VVLYSTDYFADVTRKINVEVVAPQLRCTRVEPVRSATMAGREALADAAVKLAKTATAGSVTCTVHV
jgi:hypothetical protein